MGILDRLVSGVHEKLDVIINLNHATLCGISKILERLEKPMAESPEVAEFCNRVELAFANVAADIERLLARNPGLSQEDKDVLNGIASAAESLAAKVPEE